MHHKLFKSIILLFVTVFLFTRCNQEKTQSKEEVIIPQKFADVIGSFTAGNVHMNDPIQIQFQDNIVEYEVVGQELGSDILSIDPGIKGSVKWTSRNTLSFIPDEELDMRQKYDVDVNLDLLSAELLAKKLGTFSFNFFVLGREVSSFEAELILKDRNSPKLLQYTGKIIFTEKVNLELVSKSVLLASGKTKIPINITKSDEGYTYTFISGDIERNDKSQGFTFTIDKSKMELSDDYSKNFEIPALNNMKVTSVVSEEEGRKPRLKIIFSDELDVSQNLSSFINIDPEVDLKLSRMGSSVMVEGKFKHGQEYKISVTEGVLSKWATKSSKSYTKSIRFDDLKPQIEFASEGIFMPSSNEQKIQFYSTNVRRVHLEVKQVFDDDIHDFIRREQINSNKDRHHGFDNSYEGKSGVILINKTLEIGDEKNEWFLNEVDLSDIINEGDKVLYIVRLNFNPRDMLIKPDNKNKYAGEYGQIYKPVIMSDIGVTVKKAGQYYHVYTSDLVTTEPMPDVHVELYQYWGDRKGQSITDSKGMARISNRGYARYVLAKKGDQVSIVKLDEMQWNTSGFDISGVETGYAGVRAMIYTERGVYRPGDDINISCIIRNTDNDYPDGQPVEIKIYNPDDQLIYETINKSGKDGFYNFPFKTEENDPTGNWDVRIVASGQYFYHTLKIETVVPNKLKVKIDSEKEAFSYNDKNITYDIHSQYLFGTPAENLKAESEIEFSGYEKSFPKYSGYSFSNILTDFSSLKEKVFDGKLDTAGRAKISYKIPTFKNVPSGIRMMVATKVFDKGGRPNLNRTLLYYDPYDHYVGIQKQHQYYYVRTGKEVSVPVVLVDRDGEAVNGRNIKYRIYRNSSNWWYEYESRRRFRLRYKSDYNTVLVKEGTVISENNNVNIFFVPNERGEYLIEVQDGDFEGHIASTYISAYPYGYIPSGDSDAGTLALRSDKNKYYTGETAKVVFPAPKEGAILMTLENGSHIMESKWVSPPSEGEELTLEIPVTNSMVPTSYVTVSVIQPHNQTANDRPIRMYGILPLNVEDPYTHQQFAVEIPDVLKPKQDFTIKVHNKDNSKTQFTIAVVDEGLLDLTNFRTPDPWREFFKKLRLQVESYDLFNYIIGANKGDVFKTFSIGGDMDYRESQASPMKGLKRFEPVCLFKGPVETNASGDAEVSFTMPDYIGSVRVMVVSANNNQYGNYEKAVPVKTELMVQPVLPRVIGPDERFTIPVSVFAMKENIGKVNVNITTEGPVNIIGSKSASLAFNKEDDKDVFFKLSTDAAVGQGKVTITAKSKDYQAAKTINLMVRPSAARLYDAEEKKLNTGERVEFTIPNNGITGTNTAKLTMNVFPNMEFSHRLQWLIHYPYGCIEQTTSSVFPQLYLKKFMNGTYKSDEIDANINAGIDRLNMFVTPQGGFAYWPGGTSPSDWGTNYGGHFLIEAKKQGYYVPEYMLEKVCGYMEREARYHRGSLTTRVNRAFVLSLDNRNVRSELNYLRENSMDQMNDMQKWMLAAAYKNLGSDDMARKILTNTGTTVDNYNEFSGSYGSGNRDLAVILYCKLILDGQTSGELLAKEIARKLSEQRWYSTQTTGYMLLSLGKYFEAAGISGESEVKLIGYLEFPDGEKVNFDQKDIYEYRFNKYFGKSFAIYLDKASTVNSVYVNLSWTGIPLIDEMQGESKNLKLNVNWYNENGDNIDPSQLKQGTTIWGHFKVHNTSDVPEVEEVALVQILPSGWEIENTRLSQEVMPSWMNEYKTGREEYLDIRDDRIMWFFDVRNNNPIDFVVKLNVVTLGEFRMPPTKVEAMYNNDYKASVSGMDVKVVK